MNKELAIEIVKYGGVGFTEKEVTEALIYIRRMTEFIEIVKHSGLNHDHTLIIRASDTFEEYKTRFLNYFRNNYQPIKYEYMLDIAEFKVAKEVLSDEGN